MTEQNRRRVRALWGRRMVDKLKALVAAGGLLVMPLFAIEKCSVTFNVELPAEEQSENE